MADPMFGACSGRSPYRGERPNRTPIFVTRTNTSERPNAFALFRLKSWACSPELSLEHYDPKMGNNKFKLCRTCSGLSERTNGEHRGS
jgi:hypothetical protein